MRSVAGGSPRTTNQTANICTVCGAAINGRRVLVSREPKGYACAPCVRRVMA